MSSGSLWWNMGFSDSTALRHAPRQARGQRKVEHIVRSAEALFAEVGFEQSTTNAIAARAGISIGSLYQFFASKEAILLVMASRYLDQTRRAVDRNATVPAADFEHFITKLLTTLVKLQEQRPYFLQCLGRSQPSPVLQSAVADLNSYMVGRMSEVLERQGGAESPRVLRLQARVCVETMGALLPLAVRSRGRDRTLAMREIVTILTRYVGPTSQQQERSKE